MSRLLEEIGEVANLNLFCEPPVVRFYEGNGFRPTSYPEPRSQFHGTKYTRRLLKRVG
jgi:hypothetical protein